MPRQNKKITTWVGISQGKKGTQTYSLYEIELSIEEICKRTIQFMIEWANPFLGDTTRNITP
jgi:hypothetical protein